MRKPVLSLRREVLAPLDAEELAAVQAGVDNSQTREGICTLLRITQRSVCICDA